MNLVTVQKVIAAASLLIAVTLTIVVVAKYWNFSSSNSAVRSAAVTLEAKPSANAGFSFTLLEEPRALPELRFVDGEDRALTLADFRGRLVLLNIWATWCGPCRREMPTLDRLQAMLGGPDFEVVALSIDRQGAPVVKAFYRELGLKSLSVYADKSSRVMRQLGVVGIPTTLLVDRKGRELGRLVGPAEWDSPELIAFLREHLTKPNKPHASAPIQSTEDQTQQKDQ
ncbi:MAG: TlpA disulfide reductase family protein [Proteobacteria bacterium]|nr:TlpA disulfide reductase family protein [Pseudomonadota bacterium]